MRSARPKPLHLLCGRPLVLHVVYALEMLGVDRTVIVVGHAGDQVQAKVSDLAPPWAHVTFARQEQQNGTGDATQAGLRVIPGDDLDDDSTILVLLGDLPLLRAETLDALVSEHVANQHAATILSSTLDDPTGYGRIVRAPQKGTPGRVLRIVEQRDATPEELAITEWNTGVMAFRRDLLGPALRQLSPDNAQGQYYLTDVIENLARLGHVIGTVHAPAEETLGINDRWQLALAEREMRNRTNRHWLLNGVTMLDPRQTFIDVTVKLGRDVTLFPGTMLQGTTTVGDGAELGPSVRLADCTIGAGCRVEHTVAERATIGDEAVVGPFAHLAGGTQVTAGAITGAFYTAPGNDEGA